MVCILLLQVLQGIPDSKKFNRDILACVNGIKAAFLMVFGPYRTTEISIKCAKDAVDLDSSQGWYYFLVGKGEYRLRRHKNREQYPSDDEIDFMERARQLEFKCEIVDMFLIEMYSEMIEKQKYRENYLDKTIELCR